MTAVEVPKIDLLRRANENLQRMVIAILATHPNPTGGKQ